MEVISSKQSTTEGGKRSGSHEVERPGGSIADFDNVETHRKSCPGGKGGSNGATGGKFGPHLSGARGGGKAVVQGKKAKADRRREVNGRIIPKGKIQRGLREKKNEPRPLPEKLSEEKLGREKQQHVGRDK